MSAGGRAGGESAMSARFDVIATVPSILDGFRAASMIGRAQESGVISLEVHDLRNWAHDRHRTIDDRPFGGGAGMVLKPEPLFAAIEAVRNPEESRLLVMSPRGDRLTQAEAAELAGWLAAGPAPDLDAPAGAEAPEAVPPATASPTLQATPPRQATSTPQARQIVLVCGRYEGIDERVIEHFRPELVSIGDYVICGGEVAAMVVIEAVARLLPGFVGNEQSLGEESFIEETLEYPHFTRPAEFRGRRVPDVLLSGDHAAIRAWRASQTQSARRKGGVDR
jgi:tRNA (guanine37-N1)-methyltransferase